MYALGCTQDQSEQNVEKTMMPHAGPSAHMEVLLIEGIKAQPMNK